LSRTGLIVIIPDVVVCCGGFITDYKTTPTKVVLSCFGLLVGLWQFLCPEDIACKRCKLLLTLVIYD
jgi:hypothetical protein